MNTDITYHYDPQKLQLSIVENGKPRGGFSGANAEKKFNELLGTGANINIRSMDYRKQKIRRLRALWIKQGIDNYRDSILEPYGVTSTADLNESQLDELINRFSGDNQVPQKVRALRSNILALLTRLGVYVDNRSWKSVNEFLMDKRIAGKLLYQMNENELKALERKLRAIEEKDKSININLN